MSFNPHLGDVNSGSWETISNSSSEGSVSTVFFGGTQHTFTVFHPYSSDITSRGRQSSLSSFGQSKSRSVSLPEMAHNVDQGFEEKGLGDDWPVYDSKDYISKSVSFESGINKTSKDSRSSAGKIRKTVLGFFKGSKKAPSMKSFMEPGSDFPDPYQQETSEQPTSTDKKIQKQSKRNVNGSKNALGERPKVLQKKPTNAPEKTDSFSGLKSVFKGSVKSKRPSTTKAKVSSRSPRSGIKKADISNPVLVTNTRPRPTRPAPPPPVGPKKRPAPLPPLQRPNVPPPPVPEQSSVQAVSSGSLDARVLEDQLKNVWAKVEASDPKTYRWLGLTLATEGMKQVSDKILQPGDKKVSLPKGFNDFRSQCTSLISGSGENMRAVLCAFLDTTTSPETPFSELLEENEGSEDLINLLLKIEGSLTPPRMRVFLSALASDVMLITSEQAKSLTTSEKGINTTLGINAVQSSLSVLQSLLRGGNQESWSNSLQVMFNDTFS